MITSQQLSDFLEKAIASPDLAALHTLLKTFTDSLGYSLFAYTVRFPPNSLPGISPHRLDVDTFCKGSSLSKDNIPYICITNFDKQLMLNYLNKSYLTCDPGLNHSWNSPVPLIYEESWLFNQLECHPSLAIARTQVLLDWLQFDMLTGLSVGLQGPQGEAATLSLSTDRVLDHPIARRRLCAALAQGLLPYLHHRAMELAKWRDFFKENLHLTPRERECLRWASEGKTAWEISEILNISERTVVAHLTNASEKLGANNRIQAVARAVAYKLI
ncbi:MAG: autoinducer binding domain-containing protein [Magnetococcales bacterium]|nr:autoinducer binding domain-containing protein [Magnetococcales bacterium]